MKAEKVAARIERLLDQLELPETDARETELIKAKVEFLRSIEE